jgi:hypothetical protein
MWPYSLVTLGGTGGTSDASTLNAQGSTLAWLNQPMQTTTGQLPATTNLNIGNVISISGPNDYILVSDPGSGIAQLVMGKLPDGTFGMVVSKTGVSVLGLFS